MSYPLSDTWGGGGGWQGYTVMPTKKKFFFEGVDSAVCLLIAVARWIVLADHCKEEMIRVCTQNIFK